MLIAQNIIMYEKYEINMLPLNMSSDSFLLQVSPCKIKFCVTFYEISTHYQKSTAHNNSEYSSGQSIVQWPVQRIHYSIGYNMPSRRSII
jgi:hypothetical protein